MAKQKVNQDKARELEATGAFNRKYRSVLDGFFQDSEFFDPQDLVQVKYEMLRRVNTDKWSVIKASETYGFSRFAYYEAEANFKEQGLLGLLPKKKGPKRSHKLTNDILVFINGLVEEQNYSPEELAEIIRQRFAVEVHPRSIGRAMTQWKKKR